MDGWMIGVSVSKPAANQNPFPKSGLTKLRSEFMAVLACSDKIFHLLH